MKKIDYETIRIKAIDNKMKGISAHLRKISNSDIEMSCMKESVSQAIDIVLEEVVGENIISDEEENNFVKIQQMLKERLCK